MCNRWVFLCAFSMLLCLTSKVGAAEEVPLPLREPIEASEMKAYENIPFTRENFAKVENGMTEEQVLQLLGKPLTLTKEHRTHDRWTLHYFYAGGFQVNFKNGLVVGKVEGK